MSRLSIRLSQSHRLCTVHNKPVLSADQRRNYASGSKQNLEKEEKRSETVFQYAGKHSKRADRVYLWGYAATGALGVRAMLKPKKHQQPIISRMVPQRHQFWEKIDLKVHNVACGYGFSLFLCTSKSDNTHFLYGTGINTDSQLGYQEYPRNSGRILDYVIEPVNIELPLQFPDKVKFLHVGAGRAHTVVVTDREGVFSLGNNAHGQCGRGIIEGENYRANEVISRVVVEGETIQVECGQDHTIFLTEDGRIISCGLGADGQTGVGHYDAVDEPEVVRGDIEGEQMVHISSKGDTVLAVSERGNVFGWGNSEYSQLAAATSSQQLNVPKHLPFTNVGHVVKVAAAGSSCALLNDKGEVYVWGYGILGKGPKVEDSINPTLIPPTLFGKNEFNPDVKVVDIKCGLTHFAALTDDGSMYTWGRNKTACLGLGHTKDQFFPFKVIVPAEVRKMGIGVDHTIVLCKAFV